jgi:hypothetical protein
MKCWYGNPKNTDHFEDPLVNARTINWIVNKSGGREWSGFIWFRTEVIGGFL